MITRCSGLVPDFGNIRLYSNFFPFGENAGPRTLSPGGFYRYQPRIRALRRNIAEFLNSDKWLAALRREICANGRLYERAKVWENFEIEHLKCHHVTR